MRWNGFTPSLGFALVAAFGAAASVVCAAPIMGPRPALSLYLAAITALYAGGLATGLRARLATTLITGIVTLTLALALPTHRELVPCLALTLAVARSGVLFPGGIMRGLVVEGILTVGGLVFVELLGGSSLRSVVVRVWAYFLVQSCFFLLPRANTATPTRPTSDPFVAAHSRATALIERGFV